MPPKNRQTEIEAFMKAHPERVTKVAPVERENATHVAEQFDRVQVGHGWGTYRRRNHRGSADK